MCCWGRAGSTVVRSPYDRRVRFHTPPPAVDVTQVVPGIAAYARTATRLHPRPGAVSARMSHVGGPLLWPAGEPWPTCTAPCEVTWTEPMPAAAIELLHGIREFTQAETSPAAVEEVRALGSGAMAVRAASLQARRASAWSKAGEIARAGRDVGLEMDLARETITLTDIGSHEVPNPLLPVCQLRAADVPDLWCPPGADMLQVLWCPCQHDYEGMVWAPMIELRWRCETDDLGEVTAPVSRVDHDNYQPTCCQINPEQVTEYPDTDDLPPDLADVINATLTDHTDTTYARFYPRSLSVAPGWKAGGWPAWNRGKDPRGCRTCGRPVTLLLTIASKEFEGGTGPRWRVIEDRPADGSDPGHAPIGDPTREPTGIVVGRWESLRIFVCTQCPTNPHHWDSQ